MDHFNSKVLLFGEYSVLYNSMALVMPLDMFSGELTYNTDGAVNEKTVAKSNEYLKKFCTFIANHVDENFVFEVKQFEKEIENGLFFKSNIPIGYGMGSSGALVSAIFLRYLKKAKGIKDEIKGKVISTEQPQKLKMSLAQMESFFHGTSSGIDPLSIILNKPILYKGQDQIMPVSIPQKNNEGKNMIFLVDTGMARETAPLMNKFKSLCSEKQFIVKMENNLVHHANKCIDTFLNNQGSKFYNHLEKLIKFQLDEMSFFIPKTYQKIVEKGIHKGDYFLKMCGAGGGGFMLGFTENWESTQEQLMGYKLNPIYQY